MRVFSKSYARKIDLDCLVKWQRRSAKPSKMKDAVSAFCIVERRTPDRMKPNDLDGSSEGTFEIFRESKGLEMWFFFAVGTVQAVPPV
jgi:hypothetical protein